jgi:hypothetical protein
VTGASLKDIAKRAGVSVAPVSNVAGGELGRVADQLDPGRDPFTGPVNGSVFVASPQANLLSFFPAQDNERAAAECHGALQR